MALVVKKFGGSSLATLKNIRHVANIIKRAKEKGDDVIVVVSARGDTTDRLTGLAYKISNRPVQRELDMLLTAGERESMALLAIALNEIGVKGISFTGSQVGIITDTSHTKARIIAIKGERLKKSLMEGKVPVVAGFQGVSVEKEVTTLGRGGSDVTAVALAVTFSALKCEIYSDVAGLYTEDPYYFPGVKLVENVSYEEMAEISSAGARVISTRAVLLAEKYRVPIELYSTFTLERGTVVKNIEVMEEPEVRAITHRTDMAMIFLEDVPKKTYFFSQAITRLMEANVRLFFYSHGVPHHNHFDLSFIVEERETERAEKVLKTFVQDVGDARIEIIKHLGLITLVGIGIGNSPEILSRLFDSLNKMQVHVIAFSSSENRIDLFINKERILEVVENLLTIFNLMQD